jgi:hypothetical protein
MAGATLTLAASLQCPHGGIVQPVPSNTRATAQGSPILTAGDTMTVIGCTFTIGVVPSPCVQVQWVTPDAQVQAGSPTLSAASVGLCVSAAGAPQGPVTVSGGSTNLTTR